jgi:arsenate reductase (thioredoxin)
MLTYKPTILFVCTGNACRSQIAEGWARHLRSDQIQPYSAGIMASGLHPITVLVMKEINIDIRSYRN